MASPKQTPTDPPPIYYHPLPPEDQPQNYIIILPHHPSTRSRRRLWRRILLWTTSLLIAAAAVYLLWPSDPELSIVRLSLDRLKIRVLPSPSLDITLDLVVKIRNRDFYSIDYESVIVGIGYRGKQLGVATSAHGHVRARASSYINATLVLDGVEVLSDAILLLEDLVKGVIPFDTVSMIRGRIGLFFFEIPIEAKVSCEVEVNTDNQTVVRQNCYPE
ncbi:unnamed protein product [Ilex paraguariensis]|uniref:Late embryogenesis abundant protein LEA-2 subgroup domain-containing protein n=1 Tax=Ilex paraguariensis TaxID=185542 RepID=A0ABC8UX57_9AQUA